VSALDLGSGGVPLSSVLGVGARALRLLSDARKRVSEASPEGRKLQAACKNIAGDVRACPGALPICVLMDGLEKMNGEANERFNEVFCRTRLLADAQWSAAIAAPPST